MPVRILMPALSPTMTEGTLAKWHVKEGDDVNSGDVIAEIETDKATMEVEAVDEGKVGKILVSEGTEGVAVNAPIALLLEEGEDKSALEGAEAEASQASGDKSGRKGGGNGQTAPESAKESASDSAKDAEPPEPPVAKSEPPPQATPEPSEKGGPQAPAAGAGQSDGERVFASPLARRMAKQSGIDIAGLKGSGPHGRVVKRDVEAAVSGGAAQAGAPAAAPQMPAASAEPQPFEPEFELQSLSSMRKTIAQRLQLSKQTIPHFYLTVDCEIDALLDLRKRLNAKADGAYKLSVNDLIIKICGLALRKVPAANASYSDQGIKLYKTADVSVAVAIDGGLITPVIRDAANKGLETISSDMKDLAARAREGKLKPEEYQGGSFSISNLGMYGIKQFDAVINPPQGAILAIGAGEERPVVRNGALAVATVMTCTLSCDHRVVDGAIGAEFLKAFKAMVEEPMAMLL
jgi:pyruvate dehydrogenase E2 component (dihydrolipoamide acetyltransferase)